MDDQDAIDHVIRTFFEAFTSGEGLEERLGALPGLFAPGAIIVRVLDAIPTLYDVDGFLRPRRELLTGAAMTGFREWELTGRTDLFGDIAQHWCSYAKEWVVDGERQTGRGVKSLQLVRAGSTWLITALIWNDEPAG
jgi:hypothetical protein